MQNRFATARNTALAEAIAPARMPAAFVACPPALMTGMAGMAGMMAAGPVAFFGIYGVYQEAYRRAWQEVQTRRSAEGSAIEPRHGNVFTTAPAKPLA